MCQREADTGSHRRHVEGTSKLLILHYVCSFFSHRIIVHVHCSRSVCSCLNSPIDLGMGFSYMNIDIVLCL